MNVSPPASPRGPHKRLSTMNAAAKSRSKVSRINTAGRSGILAVWRNRTLASQICGVVRHAERADSSFAFWGGDGKLWTNSADFRRWPLDPPLSDNGREEAREMADTIKLYAEERETTIHVIVCSPFLRCIQTALEICNACGPETRLMIDNSLGEVYGPRIMGEIEPSWTHRPIEEVVGECRRLGIRVADEAVGRRPRWPEELPDARQRYVTAFLRYLNRSLKAKRNFILVTHGDCVGSCLSMMPTQEGSFHRVESVHFGGMFLGCRQMIPAAAEKPVNASTKKSLLQRSLGAVIGLRQNGTIQSDGGQQMSAVVPAAGTANASRQCAPDVIELFSEKGNQGRLSAAGPERADSMEQLGGWQVTTHGIKLGPSRKKDLRTRVRHMLGGQWVDEGMTWARIQQLLGEMSVAPLGSSTMELDQAIFESQGSVASRPDAGNARRGMLSNATLLFGQSEHELVDLLRPSNGSSISPSQDTVVHLHLRSRDLSFTEDVKDGGVSPTARPPERRKLRANSKNDDHLDQLREQLRLAVSLDQSQGDTPSTTGPQLRLGSSMPRPAYRRSKSAQDLAAGDGLSGSRSLGMALVALPEGNQDGEECDSRAQSKQPRRSSSLISKASKAESGSSEARRKAQEESENASKAADLEARVIGLAALRKEMQPEQVSKSSSGSAVHSTESHGLQESGRGSMSNTLSQPSGSGGDSWTDGLVLPAESGGSSMGSVKLRAPAVVGSASFSGGEFKFLREEPPKAGPMTLVHEGAEEDSLEKSLVQASKSSSWEHRCLDQLSLPQADPNKAGSPLTFQASKLLQRRAARSKAPQDGALCAAPADAVLQ